MTLKVHMIPFLTSISLEINLIVNVGHGMINDKAYLWTLEDRRHAQWYYTWRRNHLYSCKVKKKNKTFNTTWKVFSPKRENYSNTFAAVECGRMQNTEVEHRINKSENTEYVNWEDIRYKAAGHHRERPDMWLWLTHEVTDDLLKNHIQRTKDDYFRWTWKT